MADGGLTEVQALACAQEVSLLEHRIKYAEEVEVDVLLNLFHGMRESEVYAKYPSDGTILHNVHNGCEKLALPLTHGEDKNRAQRNPTENRIT